MEKISGKNKYHKDRKTLQGKNNTHTFACQMDKMTEDNIKAVHELTDELLNMKISQNVMIRRAIGLYRLHFMAAFYGAETHSKSHEEKMKMLSKFFQRERECLIAAADGWMLKEA